MDVALTQVRTPIRPGWHDIGANYSFAARRERQPVKIREGSRKKFQQMGLPAVREELGKGSGGGFDAEQREEARAWLEEKTPSGPAVVYPFRGAGASHGRKFRHVNPGGRGIGHAARYVRIRAYQEQDHGDVAKLRRERETAAGSTRRDPGQGSRAPSPAAQEVSASHAGRQRTWIAGAIIVVAVAVAAALLAFL